MNPIPNSKFIVLAFALICVFSCQSKKKAMQARNAAAEKAKIEQEASDRKRKADELARKAEEEEKANREAERLARENASKESAPSLKLSQYFDAIASSQTTSSANTSINEALSMFASPETPVLIIISDSEGVKDYDKPTTISNYLNYLKDQKKNLNAVSKLTTNPAGKITELELKKN